MTMHHQICGWFAKALPALVVAAWLGLPVIAGAATEETFDRLQIRTRTYTNVTVTTKSESCVIILHAGGIQSVKVADLPKEIARKLGYLPPEPVRSTNSPLSVAGYERTVAKIQNALPADLKPIVPKMDPQPAKIAIQLLRANRLVILGFAALSLGLYLFQCCCNSLICQKAGYKPGWMVWIPVLRHIPSYRAAGMTAWWLVANFLPVLNVIAAILWAFKIVVARGKSVWVFVFLLVPFTSAFAFLYLAFSDSSAPKEERRVDVMTLEAA